MYIYIHIDIYIYIHIYIYIYMFMNRIHDCTFVASRRPCLWSQFIGNSARAKYSFPATPALENHTT